MSDSDLCYLGAKEAIALFKARKLSPVELMRAVIARAEAVEPTINAFPRTFFERALAQARKSEERYGRSDGRLRPLEGLPLAVKNATGIKGEITDYGSLIYTDHRDEETDPAMQRLLRAGAIVHARSATPEFSCATICHNRLHGVTRNPWNPGYTPGGSSGGAGAALAAGTTTLADGSDIGGSIRVPASANGVVGFKPPYGRNPMSPPFNHDYYCQVGPLARSVADCALMQNIMVGPHPRDIVSLRPKLRIPGELKGIEGWRIAYSLDLGYFEIDPQVRANTLVALDALRAAGAIVEEVELDWEPACLEAAMDHLNHLFAVDIASDLKAHGDEMTNYARAFAEDGRKARAKDFLGAMEAAGEMYETLGPLLKRYRALICPTLALPAVPAEHDPLDEDFTINGQPVDAALGWCLTYPFNMLSRCPVLAVPSGQADTQVPTGIQIVGRSYDDVGVFRIGAALEGQMPWYDTPARRPRI